MPVPKGMDPVLWYKIENSRKKDSKMAKKPFNIQPIGDENDSYLKPGQKDVDDTPGKKYPQPGGSMPKFKRPVGDPRPKFQMPGGKPAAPGNVVANPKLRAISKRLGK